MWLRSYLRSLFNEKSQESQAVNDPKQQMSRKHGKEKSNPHSQTGELSPPRLQGAPATRTGRREPVEKQDSAESARASGPPLQVPFCPVPSPQRQGFRRKPNPFCPRKDSFLDSGIWALVNYSKF